MTCTFFLVSCTRAGPQGFGCYRASRVKARARVVPSNFESVPAVIVNLLSPRLCATVSLTTRLLEITIRRTHNSFSFTVGKERTTSGVFQEFFLWLPI